MKCGNPVLVYNTEKGLGYRNWSLASPIVRATHHTVFDCGKCLTCRKKRSHELAMRCVLNASLYDDNMFLTLTYDEKLSGYHNELCYADIQKFKKKLRRHCDYHHKKKIEVFNVHEYGKNGKKHWHLLVFNHNFSDRKLYTTKNGIPLYTSKTLEDMWSHGFVTIGDVTEASSMYQAQYMEKDIKNGNYRNSKKAKSNHSGLGKKYFEKNYEQILTNGFISLNGRKHAIPRYFEKIAHKHWCHFNDQSYFFDLIHRKRVYTPFKEGHANRRLADLFDIYEKRKKENLELKEELWKIQVENSIATGQEPDFVRSNANSEYNLKTKTTKEKF